MFTFTKTTTSDLRQVKTPTSGSLDVNLQLVLKYHYANGLKHYAILNRF